MLRRTLSRISGERNKGRADQPQATQIHGSTVPNFCYNKAAGMTRFLQVWEIPVQRKDTIYPSI